MNNRVQARSTLHGPRGLVESGSVQQGDLVIFTLSKRLSAERQG